MSVSTPDLLTIDDLVARYALHPRTVGNWLQSGELVGLKLGKRWFIKAEDWNAFVDRRRRLAADGS